ncbi:HlyD family secretion protein [Aquabacterium sp.]|uniref:HlyD family secretion protein n=1 Tax=Aquabacterium sp. TaxID=1872578 RepID=UPI002B81ECF9|nr:HlyD family efflux transporter periplasmic adaptor subunit [Aquabacterium sp.]HSW05321.1 HlyD family efflux transporter periplasmic adaptor subunit [Aquabacterium sp.]
MSNLCVRHLLVISLALIGAACTQPPASGWSGYVEGDYVQVASPLAGTLATLAVQAGQPVAQGAALFTLEADAEQLARAEAQARLLAAQAQAHNIDSGRRDDELGVVRAQLAQARAQATLARSELARQQQLADQGFISRSRLDDAAATVAQTVARVGELEASLRVAQLPARTDERSAARATAMAADEALKQQQWRVAQKTQQAPVAAQVADTYFRAGEWVPAGQPVVSLLPAGAVKARFFVAEAEVATLAPGQSVWLRCDGCGAPIAARITRIATQAEYTPPVIYSNAQRAKLVFMVEARPAAAADAARLRPGLPVDVQRAAG